MKDKNPINLLITDVFSAESIALLQSHSKFNIHLSQQRTPSQQELSSCEVMLIRSRTKIFSDVLNSTLNLKLIVSATSGMDHIDSVECEKRGIQVMHTPNANATSVNELVFGLLINLFRKLDEQKLLIKKDLWKDSTPLGEELNGKEIGIIGLGRIGKKVAKVAQAFGMSVCAYDPYIEEKDFKNNQVERLSLIELLSTVDIVSLHVPYNKETHQLINHRTLDHFKSGSILINTSRGQVIDENEVIDALSTGKLGGLCLDVFESEPLVKTSKLLSLKNVSLSSHIGAYTNQAYFRASLEAAHIAINFFQATYRSS